MVIAHSNSPGWSPSLTGVASSLSFSRGSSSSNIKPALARRWPAIPPKSKGVCDHTRTPGSHLLMLFVGTILRFWWWMCSFSTKKVNKTVKLY